MLCNVLRMEIMPTNTFLNNNGKFECMNEQKKETKRQRLNTVEENTIIISIEITSRSTTNIKLVRVWKWNVFCIETGTHASYKMSVDCVEFSLIAFNKRERKREKGQKGGVE